MVATGGATYQWSGGSSSTATIINVSPAVTTTYYVHAIDGFCLASGNDSITITVHPANVTISVSDTTICLGQSVNIIATGDSTYQWTGGITSTSSTISVSPTINTTYYLEASNTQCTSRDSVTISVPSINPLISASDSSICEGQTVSLSTAEDGSTYQWSGGSSSIASAITVAPVVNTAYYLEATKNTCHANDSIIIFVTPINAFITSTDTAICVGQTVTINATGGVTYQWSGGSSSTSDSISASPLITTTYYLQASNGSCSVNNSVTINVASIDPTILVSDTSICEGETITLGTVGDGSTYEWTGGSTSTSPAISVTPLANTVYYLKASKGICFANDTVAITVTPINASILASDTSVCLGETVTLTGTGGMAYQWSGGSSATTAGINVSPVTNTTYYLQTSNGLCFAHDSMMIEVTSVIAVILASDTALCLGETATLTGGGGIVYQWSGGSSSSSPSINVTPSANTVYYLRASQGLCTNIDSIQLTVAPFALAQFTYEKSPCDLTGTSFVNNSAPANYYWNFGDGTSSIISNPSHQFQTGTYNVSLITNPNTICAGSISKIIEITGDDSQVLLIPNIFTPNDDGVNDEFKITGLSSCKEYNLIIYNRWGQKVFETNSPSATFWNGKNGSKTEIVEGVYYYVLTIIDGLYQSTGINGSVSILK